MVNTLAEAVALMREIGSDRSGSSADTYHMNIEEADPAAALIEAAPYLGHVQVSDSNRLEPGAGHLDWGAQLATLDAIGYEATWRSNAACAASPRSFFPRRRPSSGSSYDLRDAARVS